MKAIKYVLINMLIAIVATACNEGLDPITHIAPGADESAPTVKIVYPSEGTQIRVREDVASIAIQLEVTDDIEIGSISVKLDNAEIMKFADFKDYRRAVKEFTYNSLGNGTHVLSVTAADLSGKSTTASVNFEKVEVYKPKYDGEIFYMPLDGDLMEQVSVSGATKVGNPGFDDNGKFGKAYKGATDAYITFPTKDESKGINLQNQEFSACFWYKVNTSPDRAGILTMGPVTDGAGAAAQNNRTAGFRFFRESGNGGQTLKLNVGNGTEDTWFDGGATATITTADWTFISFTIAANRCIVYFNGEIVCDNALSGGISWNGCDILSIGSGAPRFTEWSHYSDASLLDELRIFNKALTQDEIKTLMNAQK